MATFIYFSSLSNQIKFLHNFLATAHVVQEPKKGSKTISHFFVVDRITLFNNSSGFCVECAFFQSSHFILSFQMQSHICQTDVICFHQLYFFINLWLKVYFF